MARGRRGYRREEPVAEGDATAGPRGNVYVTAGDGGGLQGRGADTYVSAGIAVGGGGA